jgi:hypothetical protein
LEYVEMFMKKALTAAALAVLSTPAFAQASLTAAQCVEAGGVVREATAAQVAACLISEADLTAYLNAGGTTGGAAAGATATGTQTAAVLGGGLGGGGAALLGVVLVAAAAGGGSSTTTTGSGS